MRQRLESIQALRGVAAFLVFLAHLVGAERDYGGGGAILPTFLEMGLSGVDLFFLISGYVMVHVTRQSARGAPAAGEFLFNRITRIYPLYWVVTIALLLLFTGKYYLFAEETPLDNLFASFLLAPTAQPPILAVGWTLVHEMYFYAIFAMMLLTPARCLPWLLGVWGAVIAAGVFFGADHGGATAALAFSPLTFEFLLGAIIAFLVNNGATRLAMPAVIVGVLWLAIAFARHDALFPDALVDYDRRVALFAAPYALILYGSVALERNRAFAPPLWLVRLGDASYALYLVHIPVFLSVGRVISLTTGAGWIDNIALITICAAAGLSAAFITHAFIEKPMLRASRRWGARILPMTQQRPTTPAP